MTPEGDSGQAGAWQGRAYAPHAAHHRARDAWFLDRHPPRPGDVVVDAGCGTGDFSVRLAGLVPQGRVIGVEPDPSMIASARRHTLPNLDFRQGRIQELERVCAPATADLVVSRAVFHWIALEDYPACYGAIHRVLKPGGWLHAESGGAGNVASVVELLDEIAAEHGLPSAAMTFPDAGMALELLEQAGFHVPEGGVATVAQRRSFDRDQVAGFLRTQPALAYVAGADPEVSRAFLADVDRRLERLRRPDGTYDQTFVRLDVLCQRPERLHG